jgi:GT2 family glycosyltransferase/glycosyltransferase involved in cell wall biosynthesis/SAM-dependent methyltransferase
MGFLVEGLRAEGIDAFGIDISDYAIDQVHESVQEYCWQGSIVDPFPQDYDLIVCIEVLEHLKPEETEKAIENICNHTDEILFSSTPFDYKEATHYNVRPPEFWAKKFAQHGFVRDVDYDASYITPWATKFSRSTAPMHRVISDYERRFFLLWKENNDLRELINEMRSNLSKMQEESAGHQQRALQAEGQLRPLQTENQRLLEKVDALEGDIETLKSTTQEKEQRLKTVIELKDNELAELQEGYKLLEQSRVTLTQSLSELKSQLSMARFQIRELSKAVQKLEERNHSLDQRWASLESTRAWRVINLYWNAKSKLFPPDTFRGRVYRSIVNRFGPVRDESESKIQVSDPKVSAGPLGRQASQTESTTPPSELPRELLKAKERYKPRVPVPHHQEDVDIVICVHNALEDVRRCLESIIRSTEPPYQIILVDDGSDDETRQFLEEFAPAQNAILVRNADARGYTVAANQGLEISNANFVVLLNSDVVVTRHWLDQMIACAESDDDIGIVGPMSNTASWQSIPELFNTEGDWAPNPLPEGATLEQAAKILRMYSGRTYPQISFLNGFCLLIKRAVISQVGSLDEQTFAEGYGEENDYCIRALKAGWKLAVADDTYLFHAQSRSYSHERRMVLTDRGNKLLAAKHGQEIINQGADTCRSDRVIQGVRARARVQFEREDAVANGLRMWEGKKIYFLLPIAEPGGGGHVVLQEAKAMQRMGVDVRLLNLLDFKSAFESGHPELEIPIEYIESIDEIYTQNLSADAAIATVYHSVRWIRAFQDSNPGVVPGYYIQDYEPNFFPPDSTEYRNARDSYTLFPDMVLLTKTSWTRQKLFKELNIDAVVVGPSVQLDIFQPRKQILSRGGDAPVRIAAMVRPSTPRRQPGLTVRILREIESKYGKKVEIFLFGARPDDEDYKSLKPGRNWHHLGIIDRYQLAALFNEVDIFMDLSSYQAMGLSALEAMASGAGVIVPAAGGATEFAQQNHNAIVVDTGQPDVCVSALDKLIAEPSLLQAIRQTSMFDVCQYSPEIAAYNILAALFPAIHNDGVDE